MKVLNLLVCVVLVNSLLLTGCQKNPDDPNKKTDNLSVSKYSEITKINYEETDDGYKAAFYRIEDITVERVKDWLGTCDAGSQYYEFIYSDPDSWDMFIYYPYEEGTSMAYNNFKFCLDDSMVKIYVESEDTFNQDQQHSYILICIQAPSRGAWPNSSQLFIDGKQIECKNSAFTT